MPSSKKSKFIAVGLLAAGCAAAVTAYAMRRKRDKAVDAELAGMLDDVQSSTSPAPKSVEAGAPAIGRSEILDLMGAMPVVDAKATTFAKPTLQS